MSAGAMRYVLSTPVVAVTDTVCAEDCGDQVQLVVVPINRLVEAHATTEEKSGCACEGATSAASSRMRRSRGRWRVRRKAALHVKRQMVLCDFFAEY